MSRSALSAIAVLAAGILPRLAQAQTPAPPGPPAGSGGTGFVQYQQGFEWTTADGAYSLKLGGFVQPRYEADVAEAGDSINRATFRLESGRLLVGGHVGGEQITYQLELETTTPDAPALDYFVDVELMPELSLRAGQDKLYFTRVWWANDRSIDLLERPLAAEDLRYDRDIGVWAHGQLLDDRISYHLGVSNGAGPNQANDNIDVASLVRVDLAVLGRPFEAFVGNLVRDPELRVMVGAGAIHDLVELPDRIAGMPVGNRDVDANGEIDNVRVWSTSLDAALRWHGLELVAEGIWRHERWGSILDHSDNQALAAVIQPDGQGHRNYLAGYVHASYPLVPDHLQVEARVGHARVALLGVGGRELAIMPPGDRQVEATAQLRYFHDSSLSLGGSYTFTNYNNRSGPELAGDIDHLFIAQGQLNF